MRRIAIVFILLALLISVLPTFLYPRTVSAQPCIAQLESFFVNPAPSATVTIGSTFGVTVRLENNGPGDALTAYVNLVVSGPASIVAGQNAPGQNPANPVRLNSTHTIQLDWILTCTGQGQVTINAVPDGTDSGGAISGACIYTDTRIINQKSRCFIATAAYGSGSDSHVETLRDFRDQYLLTNPAGERFTSLYYEYSPPLADFIDEHPTLKPIVRAGLSPAVAMSMVAVNTNTTAKIAILLSLVLISIMFVILVRRRFHHVG